MGTDATKFIESLAKALSGLRKQETDPILFYAEAGDNWAAGSIFIPAAARIDFELPSNEIFILVENLWFEAPADKKWRGITMFIDGDEFRTEFDYGEGWSDDEDEGDRRIPIVRANFGDKPIYYPPLEGAEPWE